MHVLFRPFLAKLQYVVDLVLPAAIGVKHAQVPLRAVYGLVLQVNGIHRAAPAFQYHTENQRDETGAIVRGVGIDCRYFEKDEWFNQTY